MAYIYKEYGPKNPTKSARKPPDLKPLNATFVCNVCLCKCKLKLIIFGKDHKMSYCPFEPDITNLRYAKWERIYEDCIHKYGLEDLRPACDKHPDGIKEGDCKQCDKYEERP